MIKVERNFTKESWGYFTSLFDGLSPIYGKPCHYMQDWERTNINSDLHILVKPTQDTRNLHPYSSRPFILSGDGWAWPARAGFTQESDEFFIDLVFEIAVPDLNMLYSHPNFERDLKQCGIYIKPEGAAYAFLDCPNMGENDFKELRRITRYTKKSFDAYEFYWITRLRPEKYQYYEAMLYSDYYSYWLSKNCLKIPLGEESYWNFLAEKGLLHAVTAYDGNNLIGVAYFTVTDSEVCWLGSRRKLGYEVNRIGNSLLMYACRRAYNYGLPLNLGIAWIDYKAEWKPYIVYKKGLRAGPEFKDILIEKDIWLD